MGQDFSYHISEDITEECRTVRAICKKHSNMLCNWTLLEKIKGKYSYIYKSEVPVKSIGTAYTFLSVIFKEEMLRERKGKISRTMRVK